MAQEFSSNVVGTDGEASQGLRSELVGDANRLKDTAKEQAGAKLNQGMEQATKTARSASSALSRAADELRNDDNAPDWLASAMSSVARQIEDYAGRVDSTSPQAIASEAKRFARQSPTAFLAASAAAGFVAARFLRAGAEYQGAQSSNAGGTSAGGASAGGASTSTGYPAYSEPQRDYTEQTSWDQPASAFNFTGGQA